LLFVSPEIGSVTFIDQSYTFSKLLSMVETFKDEFSNRVKKGGWAITFPLESASSYL
jgi:hypothetical protein